MLGFGKYEKKDEVKKTKAVKNHEKRVKDNHSWPSIEFPKDFKRKYNGKERRIVP